MSNELNTMEMRAAHGDVVIRDRPTLESTEIGSIPEGNVIIVDFDSRTEADGYIWLQHVQGWSPERSVDDSEVLLIRAVLDAFFHSGGDQPIEAQPSAEILDRAEGGIDGGNFPLPQGDVETVNPGAPKIMSLPRLKSLFSRLPVAIEQTNSFQYFGNNVFAVTDGKDFNYDGYSQGLHGGLDFANKSSNIPIYAATDCTYVQTIKSSPNLQIWTKAGDYTIIYQHITKPRKFAVGEFISADTVIAEIEPVPWFHLHFEIRYKADWIINPLWLMPDALIAQIVGKFNPTTPNTGKTSSTFKYFYNTPQWNRWVTPMEQPIIARGGRLLGPRA